MSESMDTTRSYPPYVTYLAVSENALMILFELIAITTMSVLLLLARFRPWKLKVQQLSGCLIVFFTVHIVGNLVTFPYNIYRVFWWTPPAIPNLYNPYVLYWIGIMGLSYRGIAPISVMFLTLDRILSLRVDQFSLKMKKAIPFVSAGVCFSLFCVENGIYFLELPLDLNQVQNCEFATCLMLKSRFVPQLFLKMAFGSLNFVSSIVFLWMLKNSVASSSVKDRAVRLTIIVELFIDMGPSYLGFFYNLLSGYSGSNYLGEYVALFLSLEAAICGSFYLRTFYNPDGVSNRVRALANTVHQNKAHGGLTIIEKTKSRDPC